MKKVPFRLDVEIRTPLAGGDIPTLDAVLLAEHARLNPDAPDYARHPDKMREVLDGLLKVTDCGVPHASALLFDARAGRSATVKITGRRREMREVGPLQLRVKKRGGVFLASGEEYKNSAVNRLGCRLVSRAHFFGVGDIPAIRRVLRFWQGIGAQWRNGWGELAGGEGDGWEFDDELSADDDRENWWGLVDENRAPVRPLPVALFRKLGGGGGFPVRRIRVVPPYWKASSPRVAAVVPMRSAGRDGELRASPQGTKSDSADSADFLLECFARRLRPADEVDEQVKTNGKMAALAAVIRPKDYVHRSHRSGKNRIRLTESDSLFIAAGPRAKLFSHATPKTKNDSGFQSAPSLKRDSAEWQAKVYNAAMNEVDGLCAVIEFPFREFLPPEDIHVFSGLSDSAALSGENGGWFSRRAIRRVLEIADAADLSLAKLKSVRLVESVRRNLDISPPDAAKWARNERKRRKMDEDESPDLRELADVWMEREREKMKLGKDDMFDLRDLLADMGPAGWAVLESAPRFRKKAEAK